MRRFQKNVIEVHESITPEIDSETEIKEGSLFALPMCRVPKAGELYWISANGTRQKSGWAREMSKTFDVSEIHWLNVSVKVAPGVGDFERLTVIAESQKKSAPYPC